MSSLRLGARIAGLALLGCATTACHHGADGAASPAAEPEVTGDRVRLPSAATRGIVTVPAAREARRSLELPGRLVWNEDATVRVFSPFEGRVARIAARIGDRVEPGGVLADIASSDYGTAQSDARKADAQLAQARKARDRARDLLAHGIAAARDAEQAESDYASAVAEAQRAQVRLRAFGDRGTAVDQLLHLRSPVAGVVVERAINPGAELTADPSGTPLFTITDPATLWIELDAHAADLHELKTGQSLEIHSADYPDESFAGVLDQIADFVDPATRTIRLRGHVANADRRLEGGLYVSATLPLPGTPRPTIPADAVVRVGERDYIFVAEGDGRYARREVQVASQSRNAVEIAQGLDPGENVVSDGALYLQQLLRAAAH